ncbi:MAG: DUF1622 domain-containing protein [Pyrinomonadaceae bacterium]|nr:DUF1622 domain-containing protein [Pyrinomonadaceae bacterium]
MEPIKLFTEWCATAIEVATVIVIVLAVAAGTARFLLHLIQKVPNAFEQYRVRLGQMLILSLELLVAADIIRTVVLEPTLANASVLGLLVVIRTFLSWSLSVEIEGEWPWNAGRQTETEARAK